jgi:hypothetical protein
MGAISKAQLKTLQLPFSLIINTLTNQETWTKKVSFCFTPLYLWIAFKSPVFFALQWTVQEDQYIRSAPQLAYKDFSKQIHGSFAAQLIRVKGLPVLFA